MTTTLALLRRAKVFSTTTRPLIATPTTRRKRSLLLFRVFTHRHHHDIDQATTTQKRNISSSSVIAGSSSSSSNEGASLDVDFVASTTSHLPPVPPNTHRFVLMRHGESEFNNANIFTGWCDVALTARGRVEALEAGEVFRSNDLTFRHCYCSMLTRSIVTAHRALEAGGISYTPITYDWRLNERHYGALQGLSKERTANRLGRETVMQWRRSYSARPPEMTKDHPHFHIIENCPRYQTLVRDKKLPRTESLEDCQNRVVEAWEDIIQQVAKSSAAEEESDPSSSSSSSSSSSLQQQQQSLIVAHANTLRALVMHIDNIPPHDIEDLNIPTGIPFYYDICTTTGKVVVDDSQAHVQQQRGEDATTTANKGLFRGIYISDDRKKRSFLERRRAANDPWVWALHDNQVAKSMLLVGGDGGDGDGSDNDNDDSQEEDLEEGQQFVVEEHVEDLKEMAKEALENTELFSPTTVATKDKDR